LRFLVSQKGFHRVDFRYCDSDKLGFLQEKLLDATRAYRITVATLVQFTPEISQ
jgi:hypothetical protein